jgi:hypothetical protein
MAVEGTMQALVVEVLVAVAAAVVDSLLQRAWRSVAA